MSRLVVLELEKKITDLEQQIKHLAVGQELIRNQLKDMNSGAKKYTVTRTKIGESDGKNG